MLSSLEEQVDLLVARVLQFFALLAYLYVVSFHILLTVYRILYLMIYPALDKPSADGDAWAAETPSSTPAPRRIVVIFDDEEGYPDASDKESPNVDEMRDANEGQAGQTAGANNYL
ncbi:hypothetical protein BJ138DRAFT_1119716 [Hygrophoropsis aurantiaca]|uniref:Uncharacterized protein n=1 Tax=Hygrophoropsis aurantiaca TaxID=72124 RepID=A0ACB7ZTU4_9AGAM|nr:hypothetical protein BJ138DRAFT_1119716 [Hygrophoropsis aurantiaca]